MAKSRKTKSTVKPNRLILFGPPPLLEGEDAAAYDKLLALITETLKPQDIFEEFWVRDALDLSWEVLRWRRVKSQLVKANLHRGMKGVLERLTGYLNADALAGGWATGDEETVEQVNELLSQASLTMDEVIAETIAIKISDIERIDRLTMNAEVRRNAVLREVDRHRTNKSQALIAAIDTVEDVEYTEVAQIEPAPFEAEESHGQQA